MEERTLDEVWYCVRAKPKAEHLAAAHLRSVLGLEVFCPRVRFQKATARGKVWFVEALFPGYVFARFSLAEHLRGVNAQSAVMGVLQFGGNYPELSAGMIEELRSQFDDAEVRIMDAPLEEGDEVLVTEGPMKGLAVLVTRLLPGKDRVRILLEWLGEEREVEIGSKAVARRGDVRRSS